MSSELAVRAVLADPRTPGSYYLFADGALWRFRAGEQTLVAAVPNINLLCTGERVGFNDGPELKIALYADGPWVGVTERFGVNAALVDTRSGAVRPHVRTDYHCDVSSYSFGFVRHDGRTVMAAQTEWNRLDLFDAETGELLTEREVSITDTGEVGDDGNPLYREVNYLDYFHSLLHPNPSGTAFLSNGWVWHPADMARIYRVEDFLTGFDLSGTTVDVPFDSNWDRPATFIDDHSFVLALDAADDGLDAQSAEPRDHQLAFFTVPESPSREGLRAPVRRVPCDAFPVERYGEVHGDLHYDSTSGLLVALTTTAGAALITLDGEAVHREPELSCGSTGWAYSPQHRRFYRWHDGAVEERTFPSLPNRDGA